MALGAKYCWANVAASQTDNTLANGTTPAARTGFRISVRGVVVSQGGTASTGVTFNSKPSGSGTAISATFTPGANQSFVLPECNEAWFETNDGEGLTVTTGTGATAGIQVVYQYTRTTV